MIKKTLLLLLFPAALHAAVHKAFWSLVEAEPVYPGQHIQLLLNIDTDPNEDIDNFNFQKTPFEKQPIRIEQGQMLARRQLKDADDKPFDRLRARFSAQPIAAAKIDIPATPLTISRNVIQQNTFGFPFARRENITAGIEPFSFTVAPLPETGKPEGFSGAVGRYTLTGKTTPRVLAAGSVTTVTLTLEAQNGTIPASITPEPEADPALFRAYPVKVVQRDAQRVVTETLLVPLSEASTTFTSSAFSWFDPFTRRYVTERAAIPALTIRKQAEAEAFPALKIIDTSPAAAHHEGVGLKENTLVRFGPSERSPVLRRLAAGEHVAPLERSEGWVRVEASGQRGWVREIDMDSGGL